MDYGFLKYLIYIYIFFYTSYSLYFYALIITLYLNIFGKLRRLLLTKYNEMHKRAHAESHLAVAFRLDGKQMEQETPPPVTSHF